MTFTDIFLIWLPIVAIILVAYVLGRWDGHRRGHQAGLFEGVDSAIPEQLELHFKENVWDVLREQNPEMAKDFVDFVEWRPEEFVRLVPRYPSEPTIPGYGPPKPQSDPLKREISWKMMDGLDVAPEVRDRILNGWDPPGYVYDNKGEVVGLYDTWPAEQAYWLNLYGDPTKKEQK